MTFYNNYYVGDRFSYGRISVTDIEVNDAQNNRPTSGVSIFSQSSVCIFSIKVLKKNKKIIFRLLRKHMHLKKRKL